MKIWQKPTRIFMVDYGLIVPRGHHYSGASLLHRAAKDAGVQFSVFVPCENLLPAADLLNQFPVLSYALYDNPLAHKTSTDEFLSTLYSRRMMAKRDLDSCLSGRICPADVVLLSTPMAAELAGFADWLDSLPINNRPAAAVHFILPLDFYLAPELAWQGQFVTELYRESITLLRRAVLGRSLLMCNDKNLATHLSSFDPCIEIHRVPIDVSKKNRCQLELQILMLGGARPEKGLSLALAAFSQLNSIGSPFKWIIQTSPTALDEKAAALLREPKITHIDHDPTNEEYRNLLQSVSLILLPYDPASYGNCRSSGIFYEAVACGIPVVCSGTEFFKAELANMGCPELVFEPYTPTALASKIQEVMAIYSRYEGLFATHALRFDPKEETKLLISQLRRVARVMETCREQS